MYHVFCIILVYDCIQSIRVELKRQGDGEIYAVSSKLNYFLVLSCYDFRNEKTITRKNSRVMKKLGVNL